MHAVFAWVSIILFFSIVTNIKQRVENKKLKEQVANRDIPEIIKIEQEKHDIFKQKQNAMIAEQIKKGEYSTQISKEVLQTIIEKLRGDYIIVRIDYPNIIFSNNINQFTVKTYNMKNKKPAYWDTIYDLPDFAIRVDKKDTINQLKALIDNYIEIFINPKNRGYIYFKDRTHYLKMKTKE